MVKNTVDVSINQKRTNALVDTGASITVISAVFLNKTSYANAILLKPEYHFVNGVGGSLNVLGKLDLPITFKGATFNFPVHVVEKLPHSLIIGLDFMKEHKVTINLANNTMSFQNDAANVFMLKSNSGIARIAKSTFLPPHSETVLCVRVSNRNSGDTVVLEPLDSELHNLHVLGSKCLVKVNNGHSCLKVLNPTSQKIRLCKGKIVATVSNFDHDTCSVYNLESPSSTNNSASINMVKTQNNAQMTANTQTEVNTHDIHFDLSKSDLTVQQRTILQQFLSQHRDIFATGYHELGKCNTYMHKIDTDPNAKPIKMPFYRTTPANHAEISRQIEDWLKNDIIQESNSEWHSPCLLVKKASGEFRLVTDFRKLNKITKPMSFPLPRLECVFDTIGQSKAQYFTSLDLHSAFLQIEMHPDSLHKSAFITQSGVYEYKRMPYGLMNAPVSFQMVMTQVLRGLTWRQCLIYLDDILVFSETFDDHLSHLEQIFSRLRQANLKLKPSKCDFVAKEIKYLGHIISKHGVRTNPDKTKAVSTFPVPKTPKDVRSFLGMCNYYRKFVKDYANLASPLNNLLRKETKFSWTDECQQAFDALKQSLLTSPILAYPDLSKKFILTCDASSSAIGFVLGQLDNSGKEVAIAFGGRSLSPCERNWSTSEQEMLAVIEGIRAYKIYLSDKKFTIYTDHKALKYVMDQKRSTGRLARWAMEIQGYQFEIIHKPGKSNQVADALSRREYTIITPENQPSVNAILPECSDDRCSVDMSPQASQIQEMKSNCKEQISEPTQISLFYSDNPDIFSLDPEIEVTLGDSDISTLSNLSHLQRECPDFRDIYAYLENGSLPEDEKSQIKVIQNSKYFDLCNGVLYHWFQRRVKSTLPMDDKFIQQIALPKVLRLDALKAYHDNAAGGAHLGIEKVMAAMKTKYHWPKMHQEIYDYIHSCNTCQRIKRNTHAHNPPLTPLPVVGRFERWHIDFLKLHKTKQGYQYVLLVVDSFTKWVEAFPMKTQESSDVANCLFENIFSRFGCPKYLVSDRGKSFMNSIVASLCEILEIKHFLTSSYHPQTNSQVERTNSTLIQCLRAYTDKHQENWPNKLPGILMALRNSPSTQSTDFSPFFMTFGMEMNLPYDVTAMPDKKKLSKNAKQQVHELIENISLAKEIAEENIKKHQQKYKERFDQNAKVPNFKLFDKVMIKTHKVPVGLSHKLVDKYQGPYFISELGPNYTYKIRDCKDRKEVKSFLNASQLKHYFDPEIERGNLVQHVDNQDQTQVENNEQDNEMPTQTETQLANNDENVEQTKAQNTQENDNTPEYPYQVRKLVKYRHRDQNFRVEWSDGTKTWEPQENIHPDTVKQYFEKYTKKGRLRKK